MPQAVPFTVLRLGDGLIATVPGEPTVGTGSAIRAAVQSAVGGSGIKQVVIVGYAGDYLSYFTTPAEYEQQAYEGGFTLYGRYSSLVLQDTLVGLAKDLVAGQPAPTPYPYDPNDGVHVTGPGYGNGAAGAAASSQPAGTVHLGHTAFGWTGGADGSDRPVDGAFVTIQRLVTRRSVKRRSVKSRSGKRRTVKRRVVTHSWVWAADDLGMQILWSSDANGSYLARWEVPLTVAPGSYRFLVTGKQYTLASQPFSVAHGAILTPQVSGQTVGLGYPQPLPAQRLDLPPGPSRRRQHHLPRRWQASPRQRDQRQRVPNPARRHREHSRRGRSGPLRQHQPEPDPDSIATRPAAGDTLL